MTLLPYTLANASSFGVTENSQPVLSIAYIDHPVWRGHREEAKRGPPCEHRITRNEGAMVPFLLPCATTGLVLHRCVVREWCHPSGSAVATCLHAAARTRRAARAVQGDVVSVWQVLHGTPSAPPIPAQRVARFDDHCTRNCLRKNKLRQRYSRSKRGHKRFFNAPSMRYGCVSSGPLRGRTNLSGYCSDLNHQRRHYGMKLMAYTLINLRRFCVS